MKNNVRVGGAKPPTHTISFAPLCFWHALAAPRLAPVHRFVESPHPTLAGNICTAIAARHSLMVYGCFPLFFFFFFMRKKLGPPLAGGLGFLGEIGTQNCVNLRKFDSNVNQRGPHFVLKCPFMEALYRVRMNFEYGAATHSRENAQKAEIPEKDPEMAFSLMSGNGH